MENDLLRELEVNDIVELGEFDTSSEVPDASVKCVKVVCDALRVVMKMNWSSEIKKPKLVRQDRSPIVKIELESASSDRALHIFCTKDGPEILCLADENDWPFEFDGTTDGLVGAFEWMVYGD